MEANYQNRVTITKMDYSFCGLLLLVVIWYFSFLAFHNPVAPWRLLLHLKPPNWKAGQALLWLTVANSSFAIHSRNPGLTFFLLRSFLWYKEKKNPCTKIFWSLKDKIMFSILLTLALQSRRKMNSMNSHRMSRAHLSFRRQFYSWSNQEKGLKSSGKVK